MKATIFDGSPAGDPGCERMTEMLGDVLAARGYETEPVVLRDRRIANCSGCFGCWLKTPGLCVFDDDNRELSAKFIQSDLAVFLTPVSFGAYSPELKRMLDHFIANISPFFTTIGGESHHQKRYERYPDLLAIGWSDGANDAQAAMFRHLAWRNAINFHAGRSAWGVIGRTDDEAALASRLDELMQRFDGTEKRTAELLPPPPAAISLDAAPKSALLLVGSPRMAKSSSASLGGYLLERIEAEGVATETLCIHRAMQDGVKLRAMFEAIDHADLCILAFPLYIDSLAAPVLAAMREIVRRRAGKPQHGGLMAIANCGFIESRHNDHALATCAIFAEASGLRWLGGIAIGGGEGLVHGQKLTELGGMATPYRQALDRVAEALGKGHAVPEEAKRQLAKPFVPGWLYRMIGGMRWKREGRENGVRRELDAMPYGVRGGKRTQIIGVESPPIFRLGAAQSTTHYQLEKEV
ncbi:NADPH-dependent FMN reductase [Chlorobaculum sp. 24CR]|uniref:flavodoxin family protein n=1 Tax=Chlorobaculum sp. 24CR TaxID=2508878 RepID=UPI00100AC9C5|nr:NAD(P)H-dependent oxidoreductase [Chlorobaculum sp. 24CR]RXK88783.1 NADPH-dependent FMN reductase [Chlorobaculum sp. 24CR]